MGPTNCGLQVMSAELKSKIDNGIKTAHLLPTLRDVVVCLTGSCRIPAQGGCGMVRLCRQDHLDLEHATATGRDQPLAANTDEVFSGQGKS